MKGALAADLSYRSRSYCGRPLGSLGKKKESKMLRKFASLFCVAVLSIGMVGCEVASDTTDKATTAVENAAEGAADAATDAVDAAGDAVGDAAKAAGDAVGDAAKATGDAVGDAAKAAGDAVEEATK